MGLLIKVALRKDCVGCTALCAIDTTLKGKIQKPELVRPPLRKKRSACGQCWWCTAHLVQQTIPSYPIPSHLVITPLLSRNFPFWAGHGLFSLTLMGLPSPPFFFYYTFTLSQGRLKTRLYWDLGHLRKMAKLGCF